MTSRRSYPTASTGASWLRADRSAGTVSTHRLRCFLPNFPGFIDPFFCYPFIHELLTVLAVCSGSVDGD